MQHFHNTTLLSGEVVRRARSTAQAQETAILRFFREHPDRWYTPNQIQQLVLPDALLTSVRRAITNLTNDLLIEKSRIADGIGNGAACHTWRLAKKRSYYQGELLYETI